MFQKKETTQTPLDEAIADVFANLKGLDETSEEYSAAVDQLIKLMKLKKDVEPSWIPSPDTVIAAAANLAGILLILNHERVHVIATKALGFVGKFR